MATIRKRGASQWEAQVRKKGFLSQSKTFETRKEAAAWASVVESEMVRGVFVSRTESENTTLREALERYRREITTTKRNTAAELGRIKLWLEHPLAERSLASIRGADFAGVVADMQGRGLAANTIRLRMALISNLFTVARREWGMESLANPTEFVRMPRLPQGRDRRLEGDEEARLLKSAQTTSHEMAAIVRIAIETGMRQGEILGMEWKHIDLGMRVCHLPLTKNGAARTVPLSKNAIDVLASLPRRISGRVWSYQSSGGFRSAWSRVCPRAGIDGLTFHDLRHEATSRLFEKGLQMMEVAAITGHKSPAMLARYTHLRAEDLVAKLG